MFEADDGTVPFERFTDGLSDFKFVALDAAIRHVLAVRGLELVQFKVRQRRERRSRN